MSGPKHTPPHRRHLRTLRQWFGVDDPEIVWEWGDGRTFNARRALTSIERAMKKAEAERARLVEMLKVCVPALEDATDALENTGDEALADTTWEAAQSARAALREVGES